VHGHIEELTGQVDIDDSSAVKLEPSHDTVTYRPKPGYTGSDFFIYSLQLGLQTTYPSSVAISISGTHSNLETGSLHICLVSV
jgi:hypothetical protein